MNTLLDITVKRLSTTTPGTMKKPLIMPSSPRDTTNTPPTTLPKLPKPTLNTMEVAQLRLRPSHEAC